MTNNYDKEIKASLNETLSDYRQNDAIRKTWNTAQRTPHCCGLNSKSDWYPCISRIVIAWAGIPASCCSVSSCTKPESGCNLIRSVVDVDKTGCYKKIEDEYENNTVAVVIVGITFAVSQNSWHHFWLLRCQQNPVTSAVKLGRCVKIHCNVAIHKGQRCLSV